MHLPRLRMRGEAVSDRCLQLLVGQRGPGLKTRGHALGTRQPSRLIQLQIPIFVVVGDSGNHVGPRRNRVGGGQPGRAGGRKPLPQGLAPELVDVRIALAVFDDRFAAAESATPEYAGRAVAYVLVGGMVGGVLGPKVAKRSFILALYRRRVCRHGCRREAQHHEAQDAGGPAGGGGRARARLPGDRRDVLAGRVRFRAGGLPARHVGRQHRVRGLPSHLPGAGHTVGTGAGQRLRRHRPAAGPRRHEHHRADGQQPRGGAAGGARGALPAARLPLRRRPRRLPDLRRRLPHQCR